MDLAANKKTFTALHAAIEAGLVRAAHDLSEGGLAVAAAEMAFAGGLGVELDIAAVPAADGAAEPAVLFAESAGRFLVEVAPDNYDAFMQIAKDLPLGQVGKVTDSGRVVVNGASKTLIDMPIAQAKSAWQKTFDW